MTDFPSGTLKIFCCLLACIISYEKAAVIYIVVSLYAMCHFSLIAFKYFSFIFISLTMILIGGFFPTYLSFIGFIKLLKFVNVCLMLNWGEFGPFFPSQLTLSSPFRYPVTYMLELLILSYKPLLNKIFFSLCSSYWIISVDLFSTPFLLYSAIPFYS